MSAAIPVVAGEREMGNSARFPQDFRKEETGALPNPCESNGDASPRIRSGRRSRWSRLPATGRVHHGPGPKARGCSRPFPNFVFGHYLPDERGVQLNLPLAPGRTLQRRAVYRLGPESRMESAVRTKELTNLWRGVHTEDHALLERLQQGRASGVAVGAGCFPRCGRTRCGACRSSW